MTAIFGKRLRDLRMQKKMTQSDIGKFLHVSKVSVSGYENGTREPDQASSIKLADLFDVTLDYLNGRTNDPKPLKKTDNGPDLIAAHLDKKYSDLSPDEKKQVDDFAEYIRNKKRNKK